VLQHKTPLKTGQGYLRTEAKENIRSLENDPDKPMEITKYWGTTYLYCCTRVLDS